MGAYAKCPNGCTGEVPLYVEETSGPDPSVGLPNGAYMVGVDDEANAISHDEGCPPLTDEQRNTIENNFDIDDYLLGQIEDAAMAGL